MYNIFLPKFEPMTGSVGHRNNFPMVWPKMHVMAKLKMYYVRSKKKKLNAKTKANCSVYTFLAYLKKCPA